jgi:hypothetical protein
VLENRLLYSRRCGVVKERFDDPFSRFMFGGNVGAEIALCELVEKI